MVPGRFAVVQNPPPTPPEKEEEFRHYALREVQAGVWYVIHLLAADGQHEALRALVATMARRFTCPKCAKHIADYTAAKPVPHDRGDALFAWSVDYHNSVRKMTRKPTLNAEGSESLRRELTTLADAEHAAFREGRPCVGCNVVTTESASAADDDDPNTSSINALVTFVPPS